MLDDSSESEKDMSKLKDKLSEIMHTDADLYTRFIEVFGFEPNATKVEIMKQIGNPL
jgi:hypothetical protein